MHPLVRDRHASKRKRADARGREMYINQRKTKNSPPSSCKDLKR